MNDPSITNIIRNRRSIKPEKFIKEKTVPEEIVKEMLENASWAPTHGLTEPWHFVVFSGNGIKKLAEFQASLYRDLSGEHFREQKYQKLLQTPLNSSHVIAICMKRQTSMKINEVEEIEAVACAVQNMMLTAAAYKIIAFWGSGGITYWEEAKSFFGLGVNDKLLGYLYLGYPAIELPKGERTPIEEKVIWVKE